MTEAEFRTQAPHQLLPRLLRARRYFGVSRLIDATPMDHIRIPVVSAMRPDVHYTQITVSQGKGTTLRSACVGALMEAIERHCAAAPYPRYATSLTQMELRGIAHIGPEQLGVDWPKDKPIEWIDGRRLCGSTVALPAAEMLFPYDPIDAVCCPVVPSTSGISAGTSYDDAIFHALLEVIERHAASLYRKQMNARLVDARDIQDPGLCQLLDRFNKQDIEWIILDLSAPARIPVFMFISFDPHSLGPNRLVAGQAAHTDPRLALASAILECAQSRIVGLQASREDLHRHADDWPMLGRDIRMEFELLRRAAECTGTVSYAELARQAPAIGTADPKTLSDHLGLDSGRQVQWFDLSPARTGIKVVSVRADGFADFYIDPRRAPAC